MNTTNAIFVLVALILSTNLCNSDDYDYGNVSPGYRVFDPPTAMLLNETQIIFAMVTRSDFRPDIGKGVESINVTPVMEAELKTKDDAFKIKPLTESIQTVSEINDAVWLWKIAANKTGSRDLYIYIYKFDNSTTLHGNFSMKIQKNKSVIIFENNSTILLKNDSIKILGKTSIKILKNNSVIIFENNNTSCSILKRNLEVYDYESILVKEDFSWKETVEDAKDFGYAALFVAFLAIIVNLFKDKINKNIDNRRILVGPGCIYPIKKIVSKINDNAQAEWHEVEKGQYTFRLPKK